MFKRLSMAVLAVAFTATLAFAGPASGKVATVDGAAKRVQITLNGTAEDWVTKGQVVKIKGGTGTIVAVNGSKVTISTSKASSMKVGDEVSFEKGRAGSGC